MVEFWTLDERVVGSIPRADLLGKKLICNNYVLFSLLSLTTKENSDSDIVGWLVGWSVCWLVGQSVGRLVSQSVGLLVGWSFFTFL